MCAALPEAVVGPSGVFSPEEHVHAFASPFYPAVHLYVHGLKHTNGEAVSR